jgi:hypothetical protein
MVTFSFQTVVKHNYSLKEWIFFQNKRKEELRVLNKIGRNENSK